MTGQERGPGQIRPERGLQAAWADGLGRVSVSLHGESAFVVKGLSQGGRGEAKGCTGLGVP